MTKYDTAGNLLWTRQLGTTSDDWSSAVSADRVGNVYISGRTWGALGGPNAGEDDAFVSKYDTAGNLLWTRQVGTKGPDYSDGVSADGVGNVYISGGTSGTLGAPNAGYHDAFVSKYDAAGNLVWTRQVGTIWGDYSHAVSADSLGNVYISGDTYGSLGGRNAGFLDAFVCKYNAAGDLLWTRQLGTASYDWSYGVSADGLGNVYISGRTEGSLGGPNAGYDDAFVSKYDAAGNLLWTRQLGTSTSQGSLAVSADSLGDVYICGETWGWGSPAAPYAFVGKYDAAGNLLWTRPLGTVWEDYGQGVWADGVGTVYIAGSTWGSLGAPNAGVSDAFTAKLVVPEPGTAALALAGLLFAVLCRGKVFRAR